VAQENLETNLSNEELLQIVTWGKDLDRENVKMTMVPGIATNIDGGSYWVANERQTQRVVSNFLVADATAEARLPGYYKVSIRDGVGNRQSTRTLRRQLAGAGYASVDLDGMAPELGLAETQIIAQNADIAGAKALADQLGVGKVVVAATGNIYSDFTVVLGQDWAEHEAMKKASAAGTQ
jgi:hypothetical protein